MDKKQLLQYAIGAVLGLLSALGIYKVNPPECVCPEVEQTEVAPAEEVKEEAKAE